MLRCGADPRAISRHSNARFVRQCQSSLQESNNMKVKIREKGASAVRSKPEMPPAGARCSSDQRGHGTSSGRDPNYAKSFPRSLVRKRCELREASTPPGQRAHRGRVVPQSIGVQWAFGGLAAHF